MNKTTANFRKIPKPNSCGNCANVTYTMEQGVSKCIVLESTEMGCENINWLVCDCWKAKHVPTEREKVLAKLSKKDRELLGI